MKANVASKRWRVIEKQIYKFAHLQGPAGKQVLVPIGETVINLSSKVLSTAMESVLAKGLNFAMAPKEEAMCEVELVLKDLPLAEVRGEVCRLLKSAKPPDSNISYLTVRMGSTLRATQ